MWGNQNQVTLHKVCVSDIPEDIFVPKLGSLAVDQNGDLFAYSGKHGYPECFIIKFDSHLKFIKKFGRYGNGPSEFTTNLSFEHNRIQVDIDGSVYVKDFHPFKLVKFDNDGQFLDEIHIQKRHPKILQKNFRLIGKNLYMALKYKNKNYALPEYLPPEGILATFPDSEIIITYPFIADRIFVRTDGTHTLGLTDYYYGDNCFIDSNDEFVLFGNSQIYKFELYNLHGQRIFTVRDRSRKMGRFTNQELEVIFKWNAKLAMDPYTPTRKNYPKHYADLKDFIKKRKNVIADIRLTTNRIFVFLVPHRIMARTPFPLEVYNLKGDRIASGNIASIPYLMTDSHAYFILENEAGEPAIEKYSIELSSSVR